MLYGELLLRVQPQPGSIGVKPRIINNNQSKVPKDEKEGTYK
jgi:hypothetical protein